MAKEELTQKRDLEAKSEIKPLFLSEADREQRERIVAELNHAYNQRQQNYTELDDMSYDEYYESNKKAAAGYIPPKINREDVRIVTGVTREKANTLLSSLLDYEFEVDVEAWDDNNLPDGDLAQVVEDLIRKSRKLECPAYNVKRALIYKEAADQGTVFVMEKWQELERVGKQIENMDTANLSKLKWRATTEKIDRYCDVQLLPGMNVYLGNIREFYIEKQPYIGVRFERTREEALAMYGGWERWKYVPREVRKVLNEKESGYDDWTMTRLRKVGNVEEVLYFNKWRNEFQILLNGIPMLPVGFPLEYLIGVNEYPIAKGDIEPISPSFAYSRSIPAKTKVSQAIMDEMYKMMTVKSRRSYKPSIANNSGTRISDAIFNPGTITENINPEKLQTIGDASGVTPSDFSMIEFVKRMIDEGSVAPVFQGNAMSGSQTAKEIATLEKQTMMKLGLTVLGILNLEEKMAWLRFYNIATHWTQPVDIRVKEIENGMYETENVYRNEAVESTMEDGGKGVRMIEMSDGELPEPEQVFAEEELLTKRYNTPIRKVYVNPEKLKAMKYKLNFEIIPTEKTTGELRKAMREQAAIKMLQMFPQTTNAEYLQTQIARDNQFDPDKVILKAQAPQMPQQAQGGDSIAAQLAPKAMPQPSVNTMLEG